MPVEFHLEITVPKINPLFQLLVLGDAVQISQEWARAVRNDAQNYPPPPPGSTYKRTYRLRRGWEITPPRLEGNGDLVTQVTNDTPYGEKVHGDSQGQKQAQVHRGRWRHVGVIGLTAYPLQQRMQAALNRRAQQAFVQQTIRT